MELQTTSALDLKVTKEDLIDIIIDEQLTIIETRLESLYTEQKKYKQQAIDLAQKDRNDLEKRLIKLVPSEIKSSIPPKLHYSIGRKVIDISFDYGHFQVHLPDVDTRVPKNTKRVELHNEIVRDSQKVDTLVYELQNEKRQLEGNNKRIKAKMIKNFLTKTKEGKEILSALGQPSVNLKLIKI